MALALVPKASFAMDKSLVYHAFANEEAKEEVIGKTEIKFKEISKTETSVKRKKKTKKCEIEDDFLLDRDYSLISWRRVCEDEDTDYTAQRNGRVLNIKGKYNGEPIDKELELGGKSLHIYPKYSLTKFVLSDLPKMKLWTLRRDKLSKLPMQAIKKGTKTIMVNGEEVEAIKVYYSITGKMREKHFNHNYYYRKSDGLFLKKEEPKGRIEELIEEKKG